MSPRKETFALVTLGCPKNEVDSGILAGELIRCGMELVGNVEQADVILINTCGFIEDAKKESIDTILKMLEYKKNGNHKKVYVWGCFTQRYRNAIEKEIPEVDGYFGVEPYEEMGRFFFNGSYRWDDEAYSRRILSTPPHTAYLKIADGCNHLCTFCAIPMIKGRYRSRSISSIIDEATHLANRGVKEIILVAQDTTAYGQDLDENVNLVCLLNQLVSIDGIQWIRLMYTHPAHVTEELIEMIACEEKICRYLDMPIQHISDDLLLDMGRGMQRAFVESLIDRIRSKMPGLFLRSTFIVGFPGETETMFQELLDFIRETRFERLGAFVYSPEEGTQSFRRKSLVPKEIAEERYRILMETQQAISYDLNRTRESSIMSVLVEGYDRERKLYFGRSEGDCLDIDQTVWIQNKAIIGEIVPVRIKSSSAYDLFGVTVYDR
ncbi:30S ribosomal protein S12 methylthiotransferase RimO [bacterium]|nr:30S ribosomal protein S12 methylthiotransferase RimO [bacterium]